MSVPAGLRILLRWLSVLVGLLIALYGLAVFLLGTEDVGGLWVSVPATILCFTVGGVFMWLGRKAP